jgi:hypothetical protein
VQDKLRLSLEEGVTDACHEIMSFIEPLERLTAAEVDRIRDAERRRARLAGELEGLQRQAAGVE